MVHKHIYYNTWQKIQDSQPLQRHMHGIYFGYQQAAASIHNVSLPQPMAFNMIIQYIAQLLQCASYINALCILIIRVDTYSLYNYCNATPARNIPPIPTKQQHRCTTNPRTQFMNPCTQHHSCTKYTYTPIRRSIDVQCIPTHSPWH